MDSPSYVPLSFFSGTVMPSVPAQSKEYIASIAEGKHPLFPYEVAALTQSRPQA